MSQRRPSLLLLSAAHALNDGYGSFLAALMPLLIDRFGLSLAMAGLLSSIRTSAASFTQPVVGHLADRLGPRWLVLLGPAVTCSAMSLLGVLPSYIALAVALVFAGLGTAAFHPAAASLAGGFRRERRGLAVSIFSAGGTVGVAIGPVLVAALVGRFGLSVTPALLLPAWILVGLLVWRMPKVARGLQEARLRLRAHPNAKQLAHLWGIAVLREFVGASYTSFLSVLWVERGASVTVGGLSLTLFSLAGAVGGVMGGRLSDQLGRRKVIVGALLMTIPFLYLFLLTDGLVSMIFLGLGGMLLLASNPVSVTFAQELFPEHRGVVSGLVMGFAWGVGALLITALGWLGDRLGLETALGIATGVLVPAAGIAAGLREPNPS
ncbi:MFS transporter [Candidatus Bipolaricaulota bacterium]|nr:MFS transporter [Candidatus Bipolaricaulota bacterium]